MKDGLLTVSSGLSRAHLCDNLGLQVEEPGAGALPDRHCSICEGALRARLPVLRPLLAAPGDPRRERLAGRRRLRRQRCGIQGHCLGMTGDV